MWACRYREVIVDMHLYIQLYKFKAYLHDSLRVVIVFTIITCLSMSRIFCRRVERRHFNQLTITIRDSIISWFNENLVLRGNTKIVDPYKFVAYQLWVRLETSLDDKGDSFDLRDMNKLNKRLKAPRLLSFSIDNTFLTNCLNAVDQRLCSELCA